MQTRPAGPQKNGELAMKTGLRQLVSGWRAQADKRKGRASRVRAVRGVKIETRTVRHVRLARAVGWAPVEVLVRKARLESADKWFAHWS